MEYCHIRIELSFAPFERAKNGNAFGNGLTPSSFDPHQSPKVERSHQPIQDGFTRNGVVCLSNASFNFRKAAGGSLTRQVSPLLTFYRLFFIFTFCFVDKLLGRELEMAKQLLEIKILHRLELVFVSRQPTILSDGRQSLSGAFQSRK